MRIPERNAQTLTGKRVVVPSDFTGARNAVLLTFHPSHFVLLPAWYAALRGILSECDPRTGFYILSLVAETGSLRQRLASWALRSEFSDSFIQEHTALMFCQRSTWQREAGLFALDDPVLAIATPTGEVQSMAVGGPSANVLPTLSAALRS